MSSMASRSRALRKAGSCCARSRIVSRKSFVRAMAGLLLLSASVVVCPMRLGGFNVGPLVLLRAAGEQDHQPVAVTPEIDAVAWAEIDLVFQNAATHGFDGGEIAIGDSFQGCCDLRRGVHVEAAQPLREGAFSGAVNILAN